MLSWISSVRRMCPSKGSKTKLSWMSRPARAESLVSHDVSTMPDHFREYILGHVSPGLVLIPQGLGIGKAIENILLLCEACDEADLENRICLVQLLHNQNHRRQRSPALQGKRRSQAFYSLFCWS